MILDVPLSKVGGKGLFVKEIEEALLSNRIDLAVHSMKDVPTDLPDGLEISCITRREDPRDAFLSVTHARFEDLPNGARVGTSSLRRQTQLLGLRPDLSIGQLRGNLDTRIRKMEEGQYDAIILAAAGLRRLGWDGKIRQYLPVDVSIPAIGQGALGIEIRSDDGRTREAVAFLDDRETSLAVRAERGFLKRLEGGCQVPIAAHGTVNGDTVVRLGADREARRLADPAGKPERIRLRPGGDRRRAGRGACSHGAAGRSSTRCTGSPVREADDALGETDPRHAQRGAGRRAGRPGPARRRHSGPLPHDPADPSRGLRPPRPGDRAPLLLRLDPLRERQRGPVLLRARGPARGRLLAGDPSRGQRRAGDDEGARGEVRPGAPDGGKAHRRGTLRGAPFPRGSGGSGSSSRAPRRGGRSFPTRSRGKAERW